MFDTALTRSSRIRRGDDAAPRGGGLGKAVRWRDLGVEAAAHGRVLAQIVTARAAPERGAGWHLHEAHFRMVLMLRGWARFRCGTREARVAAGDCVHQRPGIVHSLTDFSADMEYLEVVGPADLGTVDIELPPLAPGS